MPQQIEYRSVTRSDKRFAFWTRGILPFIAGSFLAQVVIRFNNAYLRWTLHGPRISQVPLLFSSTLYYSIHDCFYPLLFVSSVYTAVLWLSIVGYPNPPEFRSLYSLGIIGIVSTCLLYAFFLLVDFFGENDYGAAVYVAEKVELFVFLVVLVLAAKFSTRRRVVE
jgi:hypothetical protein